ncbi:unnamed protein product [Orchesella dallaii]|uniref:F-box domain-containing protein n=1 Tax=Orchesella dallaii TaxID=48710 RepID=A0ABP1RCS7_9HEXA
MMTMMVRLALARQDEEEQERKRFQQHVEVIEGEQQLEPYFDSSYDDRIDGPSEVSTTSIFALFPEIWETCILPDLSSKDFHSLINASVHWRKMFHPQIANELLPLVLPILMKHKSITLKSLLKWRQVNRKSKSVIDTIVGGFLSPEIYYDQFCNKYQSWSPVVVDGNHHFRNLIKEIKSQYKFDCPLQLQNFTAHLASVSNDSRFRNFPHPSVMELRVDEGNIDIAAGLLAAHGHNLSMVSLNVSSVSAPSMLSLLSCLPNLRVLKLKGLIVPMSFWSEMHQRQPPQLNRLEVLNINQLNDHLSSLYGEDGFNASLLRHCASTLERLICSRDFFDSEVIFRLLTSGYFPNLRYLRVVVDECTLATLARMGRLFLEEIQMVDINIRCSGSIRTIDISDVGPVINTFAKTLTHLQLLIYVVAKRQPYDGESDDDDDGDASIIILPKLKKLSTLMINVRQNWFWPFIQSRCRNLEELKLHDVDHLVLSTLEILNKIDIKRAFALLPSLQQIEVFCGFYNDVWTVEGSPRTIVIRRDKSIQCIDLEFDNSHCSPLTTV